MKPRTLCFLIIIGIFMLSMIPSVMAGDDDSESKDPAIALYNRADQYVNVGDYKSALPLLDQALAMNTSLFVSSGVRQYALVDKSKVQIELGDYTGALETINQALAFEESDKLWNNKGYVLYRLGRYDEAVASYNTAIKITPGYTIALINKGDALMKLANYQGAIDAYTLAFAFDTQANDLSLFQKAKTWKDMGDAYYTIGNYPAAIAAYNRVLSFDPENSEASAGIARAQQQADTSTMMMVVGVIAAVIICGAFVYYIIQKRKTLNEKEKSKK
ncbi:MAG: photosystem I assembly protein Ycf3 [Methanoregula sp. PtaU1.Bin051]|nr:MAG: photosystem I assembly protein Ycf3 [Methanoregula sp. PtaU1.Bin051]